MDKKQYANRKGIWIILLLIWLFIVGSVVNLSNELDEVNAYNGELSEKSEYWKIRLRKLLRHQRQIEKIWTE